MFSSVIGFINAKRIVTVTLFTIALYSSREASRKSLLLPVEGLQVSIRLLDELGLNSLIIETLFTESVSYFGAKIYNVRDE